MSEAMHNVMYDMLRSECNIDLTQSISIDISNIRYDRAVVVSVGLQLNPTLLSLTFTLSWNGAGDSGVAAIAEALKVNSTLQLLNLDCNKIGDSGAVAIVEALKVNSTLQALGL
jgi:pantoate kinase